MKTIIVTMAILLSNSVFADGSKILYENDLIYTESESIGAQVYPIGLGKSTAPLSDYNKFHMGSVVCDSGLATSVETKKLAEFYERFRIPIPQIKKVYNPIDRKLVNVLSLDTEVLFVVGCAEQ